MNIMQTRKPAHSATALTPDLQEPGPVRAVVAGDDYGALDETFKKLSRHGEFLVDRAADWSALRALLGEDQYDVIIVGGGAEYASGFEINENVKQFTRDPPATIMLNNSESARPVIKAFRCGFADYLVAELATERELYRTVARAAGQVRDRRAKNEHIRHLEDLAQRDSLTGLPNRPHLQKRLEHLVEVGIRHKSRFAAIFIRLTEYDYIYGTFGQQIGDRVLQSWVAKLKEASRNSDIFGRVESDVFLYLVDRNVTDLGVYEICDRLVQELSFSLDLDNISVSLSATLSYSIYPDDGSTVSRLIYNAMTELNAKTRKTCPAESVAHEEADNRARLETADAGTPAPGTGELETDPQTTQSHHPEAAPRPSASDDAQNAAAITRAENRRSAQRRRTLKRGAIVLNGGFSTVNCTIRDISETGARVAFELPVEIPAFMELLIIERKDKFPVEKRWQRGKEIGLMFLEIIEIEKEL